MADTYHFSQAPKSNRRDPSFGIEDRARESLRGRSRSNFGAWVLTVTAIVIGAFTGSQMSGMSSQDLLAYLPLSSAVKPASGGLTPTLGAVSLEMAGDGRFYGDVVLMGQTVTMLVDPSLDQSLLRRQDHAALGIGAMGNFSDAIPGLAVVPSLQMGGIELDDAAFIIASDTLSFSVIGRDLLHQMGEIETNAMSLRIRPLS